MTCRISFTLPVKENLPILCFSLEPTYVFRTNLFLVRILREVQLKGPKQLVPLKKDRKT